MDADGDAVKTSRVIKKQKAPLTSMLTKSFFGDIVFPSNQ